MREIRWHARAGQGAKTASLLLRERDAAGRRMSVQAFPEYGPERSGAPMRAYTRVDDAPDAPPRRASPSRTRSSCSIRRS